MANKAKQKKLQETEAANEARFRQVLTTSLINAKTREAESKYDLDRIETKVRKVAIVDPIREMSTFNRTFKTDDFGKQATAVASHLYGKYKVPQFLTNAWNHLIPPAKIKPGNAVEAHRAQRSLAVDKAQQEIELYCAWYTVAASGGSLWKDYTKNYKKLVNLPHGGRETVEVPMFTKKEHHAFMNCNMKDANVRQAVIYAIATCMNTPHTMANISRLCRSRLATITIQSNNPIEFYTRPIWREVIQFFSEHTTTINELNDLLDYVKHAIDQRIQGVHEAYTLKGRTLATLTRNMKDWHWELGRVKKMGNVDWSASALPIPNEAFEIPQAPNVQWSMRQIVTSRELAAEGTSMHHCVYSYQHRCVAGTTAIWSLKKEINKKGFAAGQTRALTIEMDVNNGALVQIRGYANRVAHQDEMAAVRFWTGRHNLRINRW